MKRFFGITITVALSCVASTAWSTPEGALNGQWSLTLSNYQDSCGREPTVAKSFALIQQGKDLDAIVEIAGEKGAVHTVNFSGDLSSAGPPANVVMKGKFEIDGFTTEEEMDIQIIDASTFEGSAKWTTTSADMKTVCVGSDDVSGAKK